MATNVYTFHVAYQGLEDKIWRDIEVSSNYRLDQLGYAVLAAFDTLACHLFHFTCMGVKFVLPSDEFDEDTENDVALYKLGQMDMRIGDCLELTYDYGTEQVFLLTLTAIQPMGKGQGKRYPQIVSGAGCGIIDDMHWTELKELIEQINQNGRTNEPIYYDGRVKAWDYRDLDMKYWKIMFKGIVEQIEEGYAPFWD